MRPTSALLLEYLHANADEEGVARGIGRHEACDAISCSLSSIEQAMSRLVQGYAERLEGKAPDGKLAAVRLLGIAPVRIEQPVARNPDVDDDLIARRIRERFGFGIAVTHKQELSTSGEMRQKPISLARIPFWFEGGRAS